MLKLIFKPILVLALSSLGALPVAHASSTVDDHTSYSLSGLAYLEVGLSCKILPDQLADEAASIILSDVQLRSYRDFDNTPIDPETIEKHQGVHLDEIYLKQQLAQSNKDTVVNKIMQVNFDGTFKCDFSEISADFFIKELTRIVDSARANGDHIKAPLLLNAIRQHNKKLSTETFNRV